MSIYILQKDRSELSQKNKGRLTIIIIREKDDK